MLLIRGKSLCANIPTPAPVLSHRSGGSWPASNGAVPLTRDSCFISAQSNAVLAGWLAGCRWKEPCFPGATLLFPSWLGSFLRDAQRLQVAWALSTDERVYARVWNVLNAVKGLGKKHGLSQAPGDQVVSQWQIKIKQRSYPDFQLLALFCSKKPMCPGPVILRKTKS